MSIAQQNSEATIRFASPFRWFSKKGKYHCQLCHCLVGNSSTAAHVHESGQKHWSNLIQELSMKDALCTESCYCTVCNCYVDYDGFMSQKAFNKHVHGKKHRKAWHLREQKKREDVVLRQAHAIWDVQQDLPGETIETIVVMAGPPIP